MNGFEHMKETIQDCRCQGSMLAKRLLCFSDHKETVESGKIATENPLH